MIVQAIKQLSYIPKLATVMAASLIMVICLMPMARVSQSAERQDSTQFRPDDMLLSAARKALPREITMDEIIDGIQEGLWNSDRTAIAVSFSRPKASLIYVFIRQTEGAYIAAGVSAVEAGNFFKLGINGRSGYDRFETRPAQLLHRDNGLFQAEFRTRAWKGGQRYTVSEMLLIKPDGTVLWR
jgi:hypothetical protein